MSAEQINFREGNQWLIVKHIVKGCITIAIDDNGSIKQIGLDRNQAHLLKLFLEEHLNSLAPIR